MVRKERQRRRKKCCTTCTRTRCGAPLLLFVCYPEFAQKKKEPKRHPFKIFLTYTFNQWTPSRIGPPNTEELFALSKRRVWNTSDWQPSTLFSSQSIIGLCFDTASKAYYTWASCLVVSHGLKRGGRRAQRDARRDAALLSKQFRLRYTQNDQASRTAKVEYSKTFACNKYLTAFYSPSSCSRQYGWQEADTCCGRKRQLINTACHQSRSLRMTDSLYSNASDKCI